MFEKFTRISAALLAAVSLAACSENDGPMTGNDAQEDALRPVVEDYVNNTVVPTYRGLADAALRLSETCRSMCDGGVEALTPEQITDAGREWIEARRYWELSEAWLFGGAAVYSIDPHIDTWPLDKAAMNRMLNNAAQMAQMSDAESAGEYVGSSLGQGLLGFHAIEYMLFEPADALSAVTAPRPVGKFTQNELFYLAAVAADLRNCCLRLEASWADEGTVDQAKLDILDGAELDYAVNYGYYMKNAGKAGSIYVNYASAVQEMIIGAQDIADEVGNQKIGNPVGSGLEADPDYIESPYALNSITDFIDNLRSVRHFYCGYSQYGAETETYIKPSVHTLSGYVAGIDKDLDTRIKAAIDNAIDAISRMKEPFASTSQDASMKNVNFAAVNACNDVVDILDELLELIQKN